MIPAAPAAPVAPTKASSTFRMATRPETRSMLPNGTLENCASWAADARGTNAFALPERDEPPGADPWLVGIVNVAPLRGTSASAMGMSGTCCVTGVTVDGLCSGLEGGEPRRASIDANGLSETSDGTRAWRALLAVFLGKFVNLLGSLEWLRRANERLAYVVFENPLTGRFFLRGVGSKAPNGSSAGAAPFGSPYPLAPKPVPSSGTRLRVFPPGTPTVPIPAPASSLSIAQIDDPPKRDPAPNAPLRVDLILPWLSTVRKLLPDEAVDREVRLAILALFVNILEGRLEVVEWRESFELPDPKDPKPGSDPIEPALSHEPLPDSVGDGLLERLRSWGTCGGIRCACVLSVETGRLRVVRVRAVDSAKPAGIALGGALESCAGGETRTTGLGASGGNTGK